MKDYPYSNKPALDKIGELRARIQVMEWDAISGDVPTWYAWECIDRWENEIEQLQEVIHDSLMNTTRRAS